MRGQEIKSLHVRANGDIFATTGYFDPLLGSFGDVYRSTDEGATWKRVSAINDEVLSLTVDVNGYIYAGTKFRQLCGFLVWCDYGDVYRSTNNGESWTKVASKLDDGVTSLVTNSKGRIFAGTSEGLFRATPTLEFWHKVYEANILTLAINAKDEIFMGTTAGVYRSTDGGDSWYRVGLQSYQVLSLLADNGGNIFAGTNTGGIFNSTDNGDTWTALNSGLPNLGVAALAINQSTRQIFAGTSGNGVFQGVLRTSIQENAGAIPASFELEQNFPNPFNPSTTIKYVLAQPIEVKLIIYDMLGRRVRTLVDQHQQAGRYAITWDGRNEQGQSVASGTFIYQLRAGDPSASSGQAFVQTRRMALVR
jgi:hypothetical protein